MNIIENKDGHVKLYDGKIQCEIPRDVSALALFGNNPAIPGGQYRDDGWIYVDNKQIRKWFVSFVNPCSCYHDALIWKPKLDNIRRLEKRRWFFLERLRGLNPGWNKIVEKIQAAGRFRFYRNGCREFNKYSNSGSWHWMDKEDSSLPLNQGLGDEYFAYEALLRHYRKPYTLYHDAFLRSVDNHYASGFDESKLLKLVINDREYLFKRSSQEFPEFYFDKIAYPEDTLVIVVPR